VYEDTPTEQLAWWAFAECIEMNAWTYAAMQGQTKRRDGKTSRAPKASFFGGGKSRGEDMGQPQIKKATFEITKKKEVGVSDLTLLSKVSNEAINENLKKRFEHGEIYVSRANMLSCLVVG
jgi:myosin heavy subunit